jgi:uncharacterized repeat protein (TIGR02543 family)
VTYNANGGTTTITDTITYLNGQVVTVQFTPAPTRTGYTFLGWATGSAVTAAQYTATGTSTFTIEDDVTLYAVWSVIQVGDLDEDPGDDNDTGSKSGGNDKGKSGNVSKSSSSSGRSGSGGTVVVPAGNPAASTSTIADTPAPTTPTPEISVTPGTPDTPDTTVVPDKEPPKTVIEQDNWALINLLLTLLTLIIMIALVITWFTRRKEEEGDVDRRPVYRIMSIVATAVAIAIFFLTEDMSLPMIMVDKYTLYNAIIVVIQIGLAVIARKKYSEEDKPSQQA